MERLKDFADKEYIDPNRHTLGAIMKIPAGLVYFASVLALATVHGGASTAPIGREPSQKTAALAKEASAPSPIGLAALASPAKRHVFPVLDERGLLLTCVAPEMELNQDTDVFKDCALAPGRTLDDVMHSFVKAIHQEEQLSRRGNSADEGDEKAEQKEPRK
jgi:hypothetical protein